MAEQGLEQILVTAPASVYYLTGLWVSPMERMWVLYITEKDCVLYANELFGVEEQEGAELVLHSDSDQPTGALAESAVRLLLELIDSGGPGEVTHKLIAPRLVERNTCCSPQQRTAV